MQTQTNTLSIISAGIFDILAQEITISEEMVEILEQEKNAMTSMDLKTLVTLSRVKENKLVELQTLDKSLQEEMQQIFDTSQHKPATLSTLMETSTASEMKQLKQYRDKLIYLREEIISRNLVNRYFATDVQGYLNDAISMITRSTEQNPMYGHISATAPSAKRPTIISTEA